jgi:hypothetical protein
MWAPVHIVEGVVGDSGFTFSPSSSTSASTREVAVEEGATAKVVGKEGEQGVEVLIHPEVKGWMMCSWALGHAQLFWLTDAFEEGKLPGFCERVEIEWGHVVGQGGDM